LTPIIKKLIFNFGQCEWDVLQHFGLVHPEQTCRQQQWWATTPDECSRMTFANPVKLSEFYLIYIA
jgi:hypothetical protein